MDEPTDDTPPPARLRTRVVPQGELPLAAQHRRLERLAAATSPHLPRVVGVREEERRFVVQTAEIPGAPLTAIKEARGGLTAPEAWRVLADVCSALAALHAAGVIHGGVAPHRILVRARAGRGRAVLLDAGTVERQDAGTAGFRAPETAAGAAAGAPGDVWAAARVAVWVVGHAHRQALGEHLRPLLLANPEARPSAAAAARIAEKHAAPRVDLPDEARLAAAHLRAQAASPPVPLARPRRPRVRRWAAAGVALAVAAGAYGLAEMRASAGPDPPGSASAPAPAGEASAAAVHLSQVRDEALARGDRELLAAATVPGSAAAAADSDLLEAFGSSRPEGLATTVRVVEEWVGGAGPVVEANISQGPFVWRGGVRDGVRVAPLPARCVRFHLSGGPGAWRVYRVSACAASAAVE